MNRSDLKQLKLLSENILLGEGIVKELDVRTFNDKIEEIVEVENQAFDDPAPDWDLIEDTTNDGYIGYCGMDNNNVIISYIYGYSDEDKIEDVRNININNNNNIKLYNHYDNNDIDNIKNDLNKKNTFYVSNFASSKDNADQIIVGKMLIGFVNKLKQSGIKYLIFDGRKDTMRLIWGGADTPETLGIRQKRYGFRLVATVYDDSDGAHLSLVTLDKKQFK